MPERISPHQENHYTGSHLASVGDKLFELTRFDLNQRSNHIEEAKDDSGLNFIYDSLKDLDETSDAYDRFHAEMDDAVEDIREDWITRKGDISAEGMGPDEYIDKVTKVKMINFLENEFGEDNDEVDLDGVKAGDKKQALSLVLRLTPEEKAELDKNWPVPETFDSTSYGTHDAAATVPELARTTGAKSNERVYKVSAPRQLDQRDASSTDIDDVEHHDPIEVDTRRLKVLTLPDPNRIFREAVDRAGRNLYNGAVEVAATAIIASRGVRNFVNKLADHNQDRVERQGLGSRLRTVRTLGSSAFLYASVGAQQSVARGIRRGREFVEAKEYKSSTFKKVSGVVAGAALLGAGIYAARNGYHFNPSAAAERANDFNDLTKELPLTNDDVITAAAHGPNAISHLGDHLDVVSSHANHVSSAAGDTVGTFNIPKAPESIIDFDSFTVKKGMGGESLVDSLGYKPSSWYSIEKDFHKAFPKLTYKMSDGHYGLNASGALPRSAAAWLSNRLG